MTDFQMPPADLLDYVLDACARAGASDADARLGVSEGVNVSVLDGKLETIERDESAGLALRCFFGKRQANVSGSALSKEALDVLVERCAAMAAAAPEDPYCGLTPVEELAQGIEPMHMPGDADETTELLEREALEAEAAALAVAGVKQVAGCGTGWGRSGRWGAASNGFRSHKSGGSSGVGLAALAEKDGAMERDFASRSTRKRADRISPEEIGRLAGQRAIERLGPTKIESRTAHVIYDKRVSASLIGAFISAISGSSIARGVSFLKDQMESQIFAKGASIIDDPFRERGMGSRNHDGEGRPVSRTAIVDDGVLTTWLLNGPSAQQLGLKPNGFGGMGFGDPPGISTSNLYLGAGTRTPAQLRADAGEGLLVTSMFGPSINPNSGDYSVGVSGMWFENGELAYPVSEVTIAGDLPSMFARMICGDDLEFLGSRDAPSVLIEDMTIAGA
ncbi:MAG: TldD/PmbA family protein [Hyphomonadaceae bacterium]